MNWSEYWEVSIYVARVVTVLLAAYFAARMTRMAIPVFKRAEDGVEVSKWMYSMLLIYSFNVFIFYGWDLIDSPVVGPLSSVVYGHMLAFIVGIRMLSLSQAFQDRLRKTQESKLVETED